jgi:hypothetical protein
VIKVTLWVITEIVSLGKKYIKWPDQLQRAEISRVMEQEGFKGCVGLVDGTTLPLHQQPGIDGEVFWDRKKRYSLNAQIICDCNKNVTAFVTGYPGSCGDSWVFKKMKLARDPELFFDTGGFAIF